MADEEYNEQEQYDETAEAPPEEEQEEDRSYEDEGQSASASKPQAARRFIPMPKRKTQTKVDPSVAVIQGDWVNTAMAHNSDNLLHSKAHNGVDIAVARGRVDVTVGVDAKGMSSDTVGMEKLYSRMLTTKMWW